MQSQQEIGSSVSSRRIEYHSDRIRKAIAEAFADRLMSQQQCRDLFEDMMNHLSIKIESLEDTDAPDDDEEDFLGY